MNETEFADHKNEISRNVCPIEREDIPLPFPNADPSEHLYIVVRAGILYSFQKSIVVFLMVGIVPLLPAFVIFHALFPVVEADILLGIAKSKKVVSLH